MSTATDDPYALSSSKGDRVALEPKAGTPGQDDVQSAKDWLGSIKRPLAVDLFSGAGGLSLGLEQAGFRVVAAADEDEVALETHQANLGGLVFCGDLSDPADFLSFLKARGITQVSLVAGGPPCQPFSRAGRPKIRSLVRNGRRPQSDARVSLWKSFCDVVEELEPEAVLFENVPDLAKWNHGEVLLSILSSLGELGFRPEARILAGAEYGVPQHRARLFVVGTRSRRFKWPRRRQLVTLGEAVSDLPEIEAGQGDRVLAYDGPETAFQRRARRSVPIEDQDLVYDHVARNVREDDAEAFEFLGPGQTYSDLPARLQRYRTDIFKDKYKRLDYDDVSRSITAHIAKDGYWYIHPEQTRTLSIREAARVQTFPDHFRFAGYSMSQFRQIGNAVPPALGYAVARRLRAAMEDGQEETPPSSNFVADLLAWWTENGRPYPWREAQDPWAILLAELCLRRTWADQVSQRFDAILSAAPTPSDAAMDSAALATALEGLGLPNRARNVVEIGKILTEEHNSSVPEDTADLRALPGVGHYIAGAVRCFAFKRPTVLLDVNTTRIASRIVGDDTLSRGRCRLEIFNLSGEEGPSPRFNLALLDLGGLICTAQRPKCESCPVIEYCNTGRDSLAERAGKNAKD